MLRPLAFVLVFVAAVSGLSLSDAWSTTFSDTEFLSQDWTPIIHVRDDPEVPGGTNLDSVANMTRRTTGGDPGAYMRSLIGIDFGDIVNTSGIYIDEFYDPAERAITSLDYSYSVNHFNAVGGETNAFPALLQNGRLFLATPQLFSGGSWVDRTWSGLDSDDFVAVDLWFTGQTIHPDFSAFGDTIQFGYSLQNDVAVGAGFVATRGVDNWSVTIDLAAMSDIHGDGVDSKDLDLWVAGYAITADALLVEGDFDRDFDVDGADFLKWQREETAGLLRAVTVPEPSSTGLVILFATVMLACRNRVGVANYASQPSG